MKTRILRAAVIRAAQSQLAAAARARRPADRWLVRRSLRTLPVVLVALAAIGAASAPAPASAATSLPSVPYCQRGDNGQRVDPLPSGPCVSDVGAPSSGATPQATVMIIAGGAWLSGSYAPSAPKVRREAAVWRNAGFKTVAVEHTSAVVGGTTGLGPTASRNVVQWYDRIRYQATQAFGADYPVCVAGGSSSGNLALMLARVRVPDCIITEAAPTDLPGLKGFGNDIAYNDAVRAFGASDLARWSPAQYGAPFFAMPIAMAQLPDDKMVPGADLSDFAATHPTVTSVPIDASGLDLSGLAPLECRDYSLFIDRTFAHLCVGGQGGITQTSLDAWRQATVSLIRSTIPTAP